ncbi:DUF4942 domain-containing protein [Oleidesulfovibrio sp.]|uniref:DUF4942 domain-containing protein n=1 Tax=Oleidesulfovibrio sp. TaxID=2909707 RepID=UPI003A83E3F4
MYNASFYPTPKAVAEKMLSTLPPKGLSNRSILEPSAGKGDLADAIAEKLSRGYMSPRVRKEMQEKIHCVEMEPELQAALRGKGYTLVGTDFLTFYPDERYDLIIMNPPFANAEKHLLHAWDILPHGDILCLVNEQTLCTPCSAYRTLLQNVIEGHGTVTPLGSCFAHAQRKTQVRISLVHLTKKAPEEDQKLFTAEGMQTEAKVRLQEDPFGSDIATRNTAGNMVIHYNRCRELFEEMAQLAQLLGRHMGALTEQTYPQGDLAGKCLAPIISATSDEKTRTHAYNNFVRSLKKSAWNHVLQKTDMQNLVSEGVREKLGTFLKENQQMVFCESNIKTMLESLFLNRGSILKECVVEAFDRMTRYHKENRIHVEGWKTNDAWRVNQRVVLPRMVKEGFFGGGEINWETKRQLDDIDRAMAFLEGKKLSQIETPMAKQLETLFKEKGSATFGALHQSTYFEMRCYKKGTLHLKFKDKKLWEAFNLTAADGKNWLPDDVKAKAKEKTKTAENFRTGKPDVHTLPLFN